MDRKRSDLLAAALDGQRLPPEMLEEAGLAPLLDTARQVREVRHPAPSPAALAGGLVRVRDALAARRGSPRLGWLGRPAWAALGLSLVLVVVLALATSGTVLAAESSVPGDALYPVKRSVETVQLALTWAPEARSALLVSLADVPDDCADLAELKAKYGKRTAIAGLIPTQSILLESPRAIMETAREQIRVLAPGGGYVLAPACEYPPNIELANALAIIRAAEIYGRYPIK